MIPYPPTDLFTATAATTTLEKTLWPGTLTVTLPIPGSVAPIYSTGTTVCGGVIGAKQPWSGLLLDFAAAVAADATLVVEIGQVLKDGALARPLASVSLKSITTSGTVTANKNPFTGATVASTTYRLFDLTTITSNGDLAQVLLDLNGTENNTPSRLSVDLTETLYLYVIVTTIGAATKFLCVATPQG